MHWMLHHIQRRNGDGSLASREDSQELLSIEADNLAISFFPMLPTCRYSLNVASFSFLSCRMASVCSPVNRVCGFHLHCSQLWQRESLYELNSISISKSSADVQEPFKRQQNLGASMGLADKAYSASSFHPKTVRRHKAVFMSNKGVLS